MGASEEDSVGQTARSPPQRGQELAANPTSQEANGTDELFLAIFVVIGSQVRVRQDLVGLSDLLELGVGVWRRIPVGVVLARGAGREGGDAGKESISRPSSCQSAKG